VDAVTGPRVLVLGGSRSGKSAVAERLVVRSAPGAAVHYLATGPDPAIDADWAARVARHRDRRPASWVTVECGPALAAALAAVPPEAAVLVDALGTWVAAHHDFVCDVGPVLDALAARVAPTVLVSDEVGLGVHPETALGRRFRDVLGEVNVALGAACDDVWLVVAGRVLALPPDPTVAPAVGPS
jgi:adenosylcobinamide kinase/adenosylcobinamide-phosphate guanylyltransferase